MSTINNPIDPNDPKNLSQPSVLGEIPSAVSQGSSRNNMMIAVVFIVILLISFSCLRRSDKKEPIQAVSTQGEVPESSVSRPPSLPAEVQVAAEQVHSQAYAMPQARYERQSDLTDMRRRSPMVIFNNTNASVVSSGESLDASDRTRAAPAAHVSNGTPMPDSFSPTSFAKSHSGSLGNRELIIAQGKIIDAVLETAINSDQPGLLRALVSNDIYGDSGRTVLLPRGSRLVGQYDSNIIKGQSRVFVLWTRAIRPDGIDIDLGSAGTDTLGRSGLDGNVNNHFWSMFGAATLLSIIGSAASTAGVSTTDQTNSLAEYRSAVSNGFNEASQTVLGQFVRIKPTITVKNGMPVKVLVAKDLYFDEAVLGDRRIQVVP